MSDNFANHKTQDEQEKLFIDCCRQMLGDELAIITVFSFGNYRFNCGFVQEYLPQYNSYSFGLPVEEFLSEYDKQNHS